jgi:hypothetical protein
MTAAVEPGHASAIPLIRMNQRGSGGSDSLALSMRADAIGIYKSPMLPCFL